MTEPERLINDKKRLESMHERYGVCSASCGTCSNFIKREAGRTCCKCLIYGDYFGELSDWRAYWIGCGHINQPLKRDEEVVLAPSIKRGEAKTRNAKILLRGKKAFCLHPREKT